MPSMVIAEKPDQAGLYESAVGRDYGPILAARGHLFELAEPKAVNPAWASWSACLLRPESGFYPTVLKDDADLKRRYRAILDAARQADTIFVATDPDREGEGIGTNIVNALRRDAGWNGRVMRVLPLGTDRASLRQAFAEARPGEAYKPLYSSFVARQQADQIFNLSMTRIASTLFKPAGWKGPLSVGRVLTPTMGLVCRRERAIAGFVPQDYFHPWVEVSGTAGKVRLTHAPSEEGRILDRAVAARVASAVSDYAGPIHVACRRKTQGPPPLFSLAKLQVEAGRRFKWSVARTTDVLQSIYEAKAVTYPRSSEVSLPEAEVANAPAMLSGIQSIPGIGVVSWAPQGPVIRRTKGAFSDADLKGAAHSAIVPNVNTVSDWPAIHGRMSADECRLFELIARRYLAAVGPDRVYDSTRQWITADGRDFAATGVVEVVAGWREADGRRATEAEGDDGDEPETGVLAPFADGEPVRAVATGVADRKTAPPPRYTDATLVTDMIEAWRHVEEPELRAILKETDGIGTEATRSKIVAKLLSSGFVEPVNGKSGPLRATEAAMEWAGILETVAPRLLDVGLTGHLERLLDRIKSQDAKAVAVVDEIVGLAAAALASMVAAKAAGAGITASQARAPSEGMKKAARAKAKREGRRVPPPGALSDMAACRAFLGPLPDRLADSSSGPRAPSDKALDHAKQIAAAYGMAPPPEAIADARRLSEWIDTHKKPRAPSDGPPSSKQVGFAESIATRKRIAVPPACYQDRLTMSKWLERHGARS